MRDLLIATRNSGKLAEMRELLEGSVFRIVTMEEVGLDPDASIEEVGLTFEGNALIKAFVCGKRTGLLTLSEDSGLEVDALGGRPGIFSARYAEGGDEDRVRKLLDEMRAVPDEARTARFIAVAAIYDPRPDTVCLCKGMTTGRIVREPAGESGFGYDPVFLYDDTGKTGGMMTMEEKNRVSHRARALAHAREILHLRFAEESWYDS